jgi:hypothetical protein
MLVLKYLIILNSCFLRGPAKSKRRAYPELNVEQPNIWTILSKLVAVRRIIIIIIIIFFKLQMGFYPVAVYYNTTQNTNNTHHRK